MVRNGQGKKVLSPYKKCNKVELQFCLIERWNLKICFINYQKIRAPSNLRYLVATQKYEKLLINEGLCIKNHRCLGEIGTKRESLLTFEFIKISVR